MCYICCKFALVLDEKAPQHGSDTRSDYFVDNDRYEHAFEADCYNNAARPR